MLLAFNTCSCDKEIPCFLEAKGSPSCSHPHGLLFKIHLFIILLFTTGFPKWPLPFRFPDQDCVCISHFRHLCMYSLTHTILFECRNNIGRRVRIMKIFIVQFPPFIYYFIFRVQMHSSIIFSQMPSVYVLSLV